MRSPRKGHIERIRAQCEFDESDRFVDIGARVRVYRRGPDGLPAPARWLNTLWGGRYDKLASSYISPPQNYAELGIHTGQVELIESIGSPHRRILGIGGQGSGKSQGIVTVAVLNALWKPHTVGGVTSPTDKMLTVVWDKFLAIVQPLGWLRPGTDGIRLGDGEMVLVNGSRIQFRSVTKKANDAASPIAGLDWSWAVEDEMSYYNDDACREVDARGRVNPKYQVFSSATNEPIHHFQMRVQEFEESAQKKVIRFAATDNPWVSLEYWDAMKAQWSEEDYDRYVRCLEVPRKGRVYPQFSYKESKAELPRTGDVTGAVTAEKYGRHYDYIIGWDPGVTTTASVILKAFADGTERKWFALDEVTTNDASSEWHAADLLKWCQKRGISIDRVLVIGDPSVNKETDRSDYIQLQNAGFTCKRSNGGTLIERRHRLSMMNALLRDATGKRRLFLAQSPLGPPQAGSLAKSLGGLMYLPNGEVDFRHKSANNLAHWSDAVGYGIFPFEKFRGSYSAQSEVPSITQPTWRSRLGA